MLKYKIFFYWSKDSDNRDSVVITGKDIQEVRKNAETWFKSRGIDEKIANPYSEPVE